MHWNGKGTVFANRVMDCPLSSDKILGQKGRGSAEKERKKKRIVWVTKEHDFVSEDMAL